MPSCLFDEYWRMTLDVVLVSQKAECGLKYVIHSRGDQFGLQVVRPSRLSWDGVRLFTRNALECSDLWSEMKSAKVGFFHCLIELFR